jgi:hypothetical protein
MGLNRLRDATNMMDKMSNSMHKVRIRKVHQALLYLQLIGNIIFAILNLKITP